MSDLKSELGTYFAGKERSKEEDKVQAEVDQSMAKQFIRSVVIPAFEELKAELETDGLIVHVHDAEHSASLHIPAEHFRYTIKVNGLRPYPEVRYREKGQMYHGEGYLKTSGQDDTVDHVTKADIITNFFEDYESLVK